jgi:hypothetical protein
MRNTVFYGRFHSQSLNTRFSRNDSFFNQFLGISFGFTECHVYNVYRQLLRCKTHLFAIVESHKCPPSHCRHTLISWMLGKALALDGTCPKLGGPVLGVVSRNPFVRRPHGCRNIIQAINTSNLYGIIVPLILTVFWGFSKRITTPLLTKNY